MKTEAEIRQHLADLTACSSWPCGHRHATDRERLQCLEGRLILQAHARTLRWVLGEGDEHDRLAQRCAREAGR